MTFSKDFLWGGATASNQYEGGVFEGGAGLSTADIMTNGEGEMAKRYGQIYVDADNYGQGSMKRTVKDSYYWYQKCIKTNGEDLK
jgi:Beta-glucosidase/6-phospho-beta-glucosidase/beta-galactosidase